MTQYPPIKQTIARPSASPPPPPLLAPPLPVNTGVPKLATISEIDNLPPLPPMPPNIPPAPPLPNSTIQSLMMRPTTGNTPTKMKNSTNSNSLLSSQRDDVSVTSETSIQDQRPYIMRDLHSDLLDEIKKGNTKNKILDKIIFYLFI